MFYTNGIYKCKISDTKHQGGLAQLAERVLSMHEVAGSIPAFSTPTCFWKLGCFLSFSVHFFLSPHSTHRIVNVITKFFWIRFFTWVPQFYPKDKCSSLSFTDVRLLPL